MPAFVSLIAALLLLCCSHERIDKHHPHPDTQKNNVNRETTMKETGTTKQNEGADTAFSCDVSITSRSDEAIDIKATFHNRSSGAVHLLTTERMPYVMIEDGVIRVSWAIQPTDPDLDYGMLEIPLTTSVASSSTIERSATLQLPLSVHDHLNAPLPYAGEMPTKIAAEFGVVDMEISAANRHRLNYDQIVKKQRLCHSTPVPLDGNRGD